MINPVTQTLRDLFVDRVQYSVPLYQRAYVWNEEDHWNPLWEDVKQTAERHGSDPEGKASHFLGAIVIELTSDAPGRVRSYTVIDGQQRLTTLQLLLVAFRKVAESHDHWSADEVGSLIENTGRWATGDLRFKVLPGRHDRDAFRIVMDDRHPSNTEDRPPILEGIDFFSTSIDEWVGSAQSPTAAADRLDILYDALDGLLQLVSIQLDGSSDAQVVFETLNSRGADLTSLDLAKNALLHKAQREGADVARLHDGYWEPALGDSDYWLQQVRQGRYIRERSDIFLMHWLTMKLGAVPRGQHLFADFRNRILRQDSPPLAQQLIPEICTDAKVFRTFDDFDLSSPEGLFFRRLEQMDTTTLLPIALLLFRTAELTRSRRLRSLACLESWLVRRMLLGANTRHYNRLLGRLLSKLNAEPSLESADSVILGELRRFDNPTDQWPDDGEVRKRLEESPLYGSINQKRICMLLEACERHYAIKGGGEMLTLDATLTVEHALPQDWRRNWPLPTNDEDPEISAQEREARIHRLGNLTLLTQRLNSAVSNADWKTKRRELKNRSQLLVNQTLCDHETWNEEMIDRRGADLATRILEVWPGPRSPAWDS